MVVVLTVLMLRTAGDDLLDTIVRVGWLWATLVLYFIWVVWRHKRAWLPSERGVALDYSASDHILAHRASDRVGETSARARRWGGIMLAGSFVLIPLLAGVGVVLLLTLSSNWTILSTVRLWAGATLLLYFTTAWLLRPA